MVTGTAGSWANRLISAEEEGVTLTDYFLKYRKLTFPIGIWKQKKVENELGGMTPDASNFNKKNYRHAERPTFFVVDGKGIIRRIIPGNSDETEQQLARTVAFLLKEAEVATRTPMSQP